MLLKSECSEHVAILWLLNIHSTFQMSSDFFFFFENYYLPRYAGLVGYKSMDLLPTTEVLERPDSTCPLQVNMWSKLNQSDELLWNFEL